jgi:hypothetical protein
MDFISRFFGTFFDPGRTFRAIAAKPIWVDALIVLLIVVVLYSYLVAPIMKKDTLQLWGDNAAKLKDKWGEERYNQALERIKSGSPLLSAGIIVPVTYLIGLLFSALIVLGMSRLMSTQGSYLQVFSLLVHASFVDKILGNGIRLLLILSRKTVLGTSTGLAIFFPTLEVTSSAYVILSQVDFFQLWLFGIFGLGLAYAFKFDTKKGLFISYTFWVLKSLLAVALGLLQLRLFQ